jgi:hypothetical protein
MRWEKLRACLTERLAFELRPEFQFIRSAIQRDLQGRLAAEDSESKTAS